MLRLLSAAVLACGIAGVFAARPDQVKAADATEWCKISIASGVKQGKGGDFNLFLLGNAQGVSVLRYVTYCDVWDADGNWYTVRTGDNPPQLGYEMIPIHSGTEQVYLWEHTVAANSPLGVLLTQGYPCWVRLQLWNGARKVDEKYAILFAPVAGGE